MLKTNSLLSMLLVIIIPASILMISSCYPNDNDISISDSDIVMTAYNDSVGFTTLKTYFMTDTVYTVRDDTSDHSLIDYNDQIISTIASNMSAMGYTRVYAGNTDVPDVKVAAVAIQTTNVSVSYWYPYYGGWGWGWGWYWKSSSRGTDYYYGYPGYYYPGYWGYPYYSTYTTGTLLIEMANPNDYRVVDGDTVTPIYWGAGVTGVLSSGSDLSRVTNGIDKAFELSPQIKSN